MRAVTVAVAVLVVCSGCGIRSVTKKDRIAASVAAQKMKDGTVLTAAQIDMLDKDATYQCTREMPLGSHIPKLRCRTLRRIETDYEKTQRQLVQMSTSATGGGGSAMSNGGGGEGGDGGGSGVALSGN